MCTLAGLQNPQANFYRFYRRNLSASAGKEWAGSSAWLQLTAYSQSSKRVRISWQLGRSWGSAQQSAINLPRGPSGISSREPSFATVYTTWTGEIPSQGRLNVHSSHMITPRLKISHFSVKGSFLISSGAIHSGVPAEELSVIGLSVITRERPKSHILTVQCLFTRQFALFRSLWTIFMRCMHIKPLQISRTIFNLLRQLSFFFWPLIWMR